MKQGDIHVDWDGKGNMLITYPGGKQEIGYNKKDVFQKVKKWCSEQTNIVSKVTGMPTVGEARIVWHNRTNFD